jgi:hypothetical protein
MVQGIVLFNALTRKNHYIVIFVSIGNTESVSELFNSSYGRYGERIVGSLKVLTMKLPCRILRWCYLPSVRSRQIILFKRSSSHIMTRSVVPSFLVQTGDRTGTGAGGESFYGEPFQDEIHPRLRFAHRGLVAMANNGTKDSNDSQFFITLGVVLTFLWSLHFHC